MSLHISISAQLHLCLHLLPAFIYKKHEGGREGIGAVKQKFRYKAQTLEIQEVHHR